MKCNRCGRDTNNKDLVCAGCKIDDRLKEQVEPFTEVQILPRKANGHAICVVKGCKKQRVLNGMCSQHNKERQGNPPKGAKIRNYTPSVREVPSPEPAPLKPLLQARMILGEVLSEMSATGAKNHDAQLFRAGALIDQALIDSK